MAHAVEHTKRFHDLLGWLWGHGTEGVAIGYEAMSEQTGIPERSLGRHLSRMEELSLIVVDRPAAIGEGRAYNHYRAIVTPDTWRTRSQQALRAERRQKDRAREAARRAHKSQAQAAKVQAEAAAELHAILETLDAPDPLIVELEASVTKKMLGDPTDDDLIDAWIGGGL